MTLLVFILAAAGMVAYLGITRNSPATTGVAALLVAVCIAMTVAPVPMIRRGAVLAAAGQPYCLSIPSLHRPIAGNLEMTLPYASGNRLTPHMMLWVDGDKGMTADHWSCNAQASVEGQPLGTTRNCQPRRDFLETLTPVLPGLHIALGDAFYVIPSGYAPSHQESDDITLRSDGADQRVFRNASIEVGPERVRNWQQEALDPSHPVTPDPFAVIRRDGPYGYTIRSFNAERGLARLFSCNIKDSCRLQWATGDFLFGLYVFTMTPEDATALQTRFEDLWRSFRQDR